MLNNQLHVISVQPYGYIDGPEDRGSGALGSRSRLDKGLEIARELPRTSEIIFLFPQGYGKNNPTKRHKRFFSLGESMALYVTSMLPEEHPHIRVSSKPLSWGTMNDIRALYLMLAELPVGSMPHIHFVTEPAHLKRVRMVWKYINSIGYPATFHAATQHRMTWKERWVREPIARLNYKYQLSRRN